MNEIATAGQRELQNWVEKSKVALEGAGLAGVNLAEVPQDVTNDKGLSVVMNPSGGTAPVSGMAPNVIGAPSIPADKVNGLLDNVSLLIDIEREFEFLGVENDDKTLEVSFKRNEAIIQACEKKHIALLVEIKEKGDKVPNGTDAGRIVGLVFKGIGVALAFLHAALVTAATGGAATGLFIAASMALVAFVADASGGTKEMEKGISQSLQSNNGMNKEEADRAAGFISMGIQLVFEIAQTAVGGCVTTPQQKMSSFISKVNSRVADGIERGNKIEKAAENLAMKAFGNKSTETVKKLIEQGQELSKFERSFNAWKTLLPIGEALGSSICQGVSYKKSVAMGEADAKVVLSQANTEVLQDILADCGETLAANFRRIAHRQDQLVAILSSRDEAIDTINQEFGGMA